MATACQARAAAGAVCEGYVPLDVEETVVAAAEEKAASEAYERFGVL